jgi:hypothetical protein
MICTSIRISKARCATSQTTRQKWWPTPVTLRVPRLKRPRLHFKACRPKWCSRQVLAHGHLRTCTGDALDVVSLGWPRANAWTTRAKEMDPPAGAAPARFLYKRNPQAAAWRRKWSQSPVLLWARLAYDACLNAGSTAAVLNLEPPPGIAPNWLPYQRSASLKMLWGHETWRP